VPSLLGKRYRCPDCGLELLCIRPGDGSLQCCGRDLGVQEARQLPSAD
jgi:hypothetical protein